MALFAVLYFVSTKPSDQYNFDKQSKTEKHWPKQKEDPSPTNDTAIVAPQNTAATNNLASTEDIQSKNPNKRIQIKEFAPKHPTPHKNYRDLAEDDSVEINESTFKILKARSVVKKSYVQSMGEILLEQAGFVIYDSNDVKPVKKLFITDTDKPVIMNTITGKAGVVTGVFTIQFNSHDEIRKAVQLENLEVLSIDQTIKTAYIKAPLNSDLMILNERLAGIFGKASIEMEVLEGLVGR